MKIDRDRILFHSRMMEVAEEFHASVEDGGESYRDEIYSEYLNAGAPKDVAGWLRDRLSKEFVWVETPPAWIEEEPTWPFYAGRPMVFIAQFTLPDTPVARDRVSSGQTLYLFAIRVPSEGGFQLKYEVVMQW